MNKIFDSLKTMRRRKTDKPKEYILSYGEQDFIDLISYAGLEEQKNYIVIDDQYIRTLFISGYPYVASSGWLNNLVNYNHNVDIAFRD